jgi:peptidyl-tRNA hydrolase
MTYKNIPKSINMDQIIDKEDNSKFGNNLVVYSIVKKSLNMSCGKIPGQCQHAIQYFINNYYINKYNVETELGTLFNIRFEYWHVSNTHTKVILEASDKEWEKLKEEYDPIIVIDAGKTEIPAGSETVMILYPMLREERSKTLKRCQLLK